MQIDYAGDSFLTSDKVTALPALLADGGESVYASRCGNPSHVPPHTYKRDL